MFTVEEVSRRRGRPRLKKKSIAELECHMETTKIASLNAVDEEEDEREVEQGSEMEMAGDGRDNREESSGSQNDDDGYDSEDRPKPLGSSIGSADNPSGQLYAGFEWNGTNYGLEDAVMVSPGDTKQSPHVGIITTIRQAADGEMFATLRWLYRPEAHIKDDPTWLSYDPRELLFTDHKEEVPVVMIMYKCVVHFLHSNKQLPMRRVHPGFVVRHYYDHLKQRLFKITKEPVCKGSLWKEICSRVRETELRIEDVPNIDYRDKDACPKGLKKNEPFLGWKTSTCNIEEDKLSTDKQGLDRPVEQLSTQPCKSKIPTSHANPSFYKILSLYGALRGDYRRDKYLERLLEALHFQWDFITSWDDKDISESMDKHLKWPDCVVEPVFSLESEVDTMYLGDPQKYNQKMRQLVYNLKNNGVLAKRFVTRELEPSKLLNMSPEELKAGLTVKELPKTDSDGKQEIQMVNANCPSCFEKKVCLLNIILAGAKQRYQLQCDKCGKSWTASRNAIL